MIPSRNRHSLAILADMEDRLQTLTDDAADIDRAIAKLERRRAVIENERLNIKAAVHSISTRIAGEPRPAAAAELSEAARAEIRDAIARGKQQ